MLYTGKRVDTSSPLIHTRDLLKTSEDLSLDFFFSKKLKKNSTKGVLFQKLLLVVKKLPFFNQSRVSSRNNNKKREIKKYNTKKRVFKE